MQNLRLYTFVNFYLSSIQQGIQSAHVVHSLFVKYPSPQDNQILWNWATQGKTMIVLNGGAHFDIVKGWNLVNAANLNFNGSVLPFESFSEDPQSLNGTMTSYGIVLPPQIYDARRSSEVPQAGVTDPDSFVYYNEAENETHVYGSFTPEYEFIKMLSNCGLAR
jgi:hypothetical protein